ncbi:MAG: serine/threonine protein kinase, partial [Sinobacteraceae bacterium]|nr:serine/threonine protein kinase [Nevskiaceae bacterium]
MTEAVATINGRKLDARYTLLDKLGAGGQGEVWRALDGTRGIDIALKVVTPTEGREDEAWSSLEHEYAIASRLDHPSILKVFPPERTADVMILPMELASGGDLRRLRGAGFLEIIPALLEIAQALEHAHERGVVHRDLKPSNVLFDVRGRARLADFGVAEQAMSPVDSNAAGLSTPATKDTNKHGFSPFTASPAQLRGEPPTPADDIYGLGALAYELLSGYPPYYPHFDKKRAMEERVPKLVPTRQIPPLLTALVMGMLDKDPKKRPRTMREVIDELDLAINDTLTFDFENVSSQTGSTQQSGSPTGNPQVSGEAGSRADAKSFMWSPTAKDRRVSSDRRGRRKEDGGFDRRRSAADGAHVGAGAAASREVADSGVDSSSGADSAGAASTGGASGPGGVAPPGGVVAPGDVAGSAEPMARAADHAAPGGRNDTGSNARPAESIAAPEVGDRLRRSTDANPGVEAGAANPGTSAGGGSGDAVGSVGTADAGAMGDKRGAIGDGDLNATVGF